MEITKPKDPTPTPDSTPTPNPTPTPDPTPTPSPYTDPNRIEITISDSKTPIVVLFGPPACGKTMTLVRLTKYLHKYGNKVEPINSFRPSDDVHYRDLCKEFNNMIKNADAAAGTDRISFMLVRISDGKSSKTLCQILEAPGEGYHDPQNPTKAFPRYVDTIKETPNRKIWCFILETNWGTQKSREEYVSKIHSLDIPSNDKVVFILNKIDLENSLKVKDKIKDKTAREYVERMYPNLFEKFVESGCLFPGNIEKFKFVVFQTGTYYEADDGGKTYQAGSEKYPEKLWKTIKKLIHG